MFFDCVNRATGPEDVVFKVLYCGMDHTDLHQIRNEIHSTNYPLVPGYVRCHLLIMLLYMLELCFLLSQLHVHLFEGMKWWVKLRNWDQK